MGTRPTQENSIFQQRNPLKTAEWFPTSNEKDVTDAAFKFKKKRHVHYIRNDKE